MATPAQPPRPPAAPIPPRSRSNFFWIVLLLLILIFVVGGLGILIGVRVITNAFHVNVNPSGAGKKDVSVTTPFGSLNVHEGVNEAALEPVGDRLASYQILVDCCAAARKIAS